MCAEAEVRFTEISSYFGKTNNDLPNPIVPPSPPPTFLPLLHIPCHPVLPLPPCPPNHASWVLDYKWPIEAIVTKQAALKVGLPKASVNHCPFGPPPKSFTNTIPPRATSKPCRPKWISTA